MTGGYSQVEGHPYLPSLELDSYCKSKGIHMTAYSRPSTASPSLASLAAEKTDLFLSPSSRRRRYLPTSHRRPGRLARGEIRFDSRRGCSRLERRERLECRAQVEQPYEAEAEHQFVRHPCSYQSVYSTLGQAALPALSHEDINVLSSLHTTAPSKHRSLFVYPGSGEPGDLFGWRVKQDLGWEYEVKTAVPEWAK